MSLSVEKLEGSMAKLTIEVPAEEFDKAMTAAYHKIKNQVNLQGFRRGKVPQAMIEKVYGPEVFYDEAANRLINEYYPKELENCEEEVVSNPEIDVEQIGKGQNFIFTAVVAIKPEIKIGEYKGVEIEKVDVEVTDEDVAKALSGSVDENLAKNITSVEMYSKYKEWGILVKSPSGEGVAGIEAVMDSPTAWISFALDQPRLIANEPVEGDVSIASLYKVAADGSFEFTVNIDNIDVGDGAVEENLKKLFRIEGATSLGNDANFSSENVDIELAEPVEGDVKFKILPKDSPDSFFIRATLLK